MPYVHLEATPTQPPLCIRYEATGEPNAPHTLVCIHELGGALDTYQELARRLAPTCRVIAFDQRGAGLSEHPIAAFTLGDLVADIERLVRKLEITTPFHLMGLAMGAVTAVTYATLHSDRLRSLILCDGTGEILPAASRYIKDRANMVRQMGMRAVVDESFMNSFKGILDANTDPRWQAYRCRFLSNSPMSYAMHSDALAEAHLDDASLQSIACPTLVMTGVDDFIWPPKIGRRLAERIPGATFRILEGAAHFPPVQAPDAVVQEVEALFASIDRCSESGTSAVRDQLA
ncbi:alpha/beta fold hydrolase [Cupriavidus sp. CuC1]|uniref:alpha/beta fold hydrolase n=1 Tax=Cupriavidus sp. CuC1 TaxID=3373131 RepID=UPI0037D8157D